MARDPGRQRGGQTRGSAHMPSGLPEARGYCGGWLPVSLAGGPGSVQLKTSSDMDITLNLPGVGSSCRAGGSGGRWLNSGNISGTLESGCPSSFIPSWANLGEWLNGLEPQWLQVRKEAVKTNPQVVVKIDSEAACKCLQVCGERLAVSLWERQVGGPGLAPEALGSGQPCRVPSGRASLP